MQKPIQKNSGKPLESERRSAAYFFLSLPLIGAIVPLFYLIPIWIIVSLYVLVCFVLAVVELIVDHTHIRWGGTSASAAKTAPPVPHFDYQRKSHTFVPNAEFSRKGSAQ